MLPLGLRRSGSRARLARASAFPAAALAGLLAAGCGTSASPSAEAASAALAAAPVAAAPETLELPRLEPGDTREGVTRKLSADIRPRLYAPGLARGVEAWEWNESHGRHATAEFVGGRLVSGTVRRPWSEGLPHIDARALGPLHAGQTREEIHARVGAGWLVSRSLAVTPGPQGRLESETEAWQIHDGDRNTGQVLFVTYHDGRATHVQHPGSKH